jgi:hypothetical protein
MKRIRRSYAAASWLDPRLERRASTIAGQRLFARAPIRAGEIVLVWGGKVVSREQLFQAITRSGRIVAIGVDRDHYLATFPTDPDNPAGFLNHACDPNLWLHDEVILIARGDILTREELTTDYALWEIDEDCVIGWKCRCGSSPRVTGRDWRLPELQGRYRALLALPQQAHRRRRATRLHTRGQDAATIPAQRFQQVEAAS